MRTSLFQLLLCCFLLAAPLSAELVAPPYLQNQNADSVDVYWVETDPQPKWVRYSDHRVLSEVERVEQLQFQARELEEFPELRKSAPRYLHRATLHNLSGRKSVEYSVLFPDRPHSGTIRALPSAQDPVRLIAFADSETEPESTGKPAKWGTPEEPGRRYLLDQTKGLQQNLQVVAQRRPNALLIAGDLVESGGEQRDWDEFWLRFGELAGNVPLLTSPGNHEYWAGPAHGRYSPEGSQWAINKYRSYFHPTGPAPDPGYYRKDLGKVTLLSLDSGDGLPPGSTEDSNHYLQAAGNFAPDYNPGSPQWLWLKKQLEDSQALGQFTIVMFHHCPYSSGTHGFPAGSGEGRDEQSGQALRVLTPLFLRYGVDLVLTGHDEMFERSTVSGWELLKEGQRRHHTLHVYDVGVAGDGLRGPKRANEFSKFLAFRHAPEIWDKGVLQEGGRHYGHLEVEVTPTPEGWEAVLSPVYVLPVRRGGQWTGLRCLYKDVVRLESP